MRILIPVVLATALCGGFVFVLVTDSDADNVLVGGGGDLESRTADDGVGRGQDAAGGTDEASQNGDGDSRGGATKRRGVVGSERGDGKRRDPSSDDRVAHGGTDRKTTRRNPGGSRQPADRGGSHSARNDPSKSRDKAARNVWDEDEEGQDPDLEYISISGTVVLTEPNGEKFQEESGAFVALTRVGRRQIRSTVEFEAGQWNAEVPEGGLFEVRDLKARERAARVAFRRKTVREGENIEIVAEWSKPYLLRVLGDEDHDLTGLEVVAHPLNTHFQHPGSYEESHVLAYGVPSPVDVASLGEHRVIWVSAPDYAWQRVQVPSHASREEREEQVVKLTRSAPAIVTLDNFTPASDSKLRVRAASRGVQGIPHTEYDLDKYLETSYGEVELVGLRPGNYTVSIEVGEHSKSPTILAQENLTIDRFEPSSVHLILDDAPTELDPVTLGGLLVLPVVAADTTVVLNVEPLELFSAGHETRRSVPRQDMEEGEVDGTLLWNVGTVLPGRYTVEVEPFQYREVITVEEEQATDVRIEIPDLAEVTLCAVDKDSREPVVLTSVSWQAKPPAGVTRQSFRSARLDEDTGCYSVLAPEGEITISLSGAGVRRQYKKLNVTPGVNDITLEVSVDPGIRVRLLDDDTAVAITSHALVTAKEVNGSGRKDWWSLKDGVLELYVTGSGLYEVSFQPILGYEPVAPQEIQVLEGTVVDLNVQVEAKQ